MYTVGRENKPLAEVEGVGTVEFSSWELDLKTGVLLHDGVLVRLQPQPAKVLCLLARQPGSLVTRAEIQKELWSGETFVDFDGGLNYCIRQIRTVLGDNAVQPIYIATVPRRGYRFIAEVKPISQPAASASADSDGNQAIAKVKRTGWPAFVTRRFGIVLALGILAITTVLLLRARSVLNPASPPKVISYTRLTDDGRVKDINGSADPLVAVNNKVFFTESVGNQNMLAAVLATGGDVSLLPVPMASVGIVDYSAATRELLFASLWHRKTDEYLVAESSVNHVAHRLGGLTAHDASWSNDGKTLAFARGFDLFVADHDGDRPRKIASVGGAAFWLRWSPDGRYIRFSESPDSNQFHLWQVNADGTGKQLLLPDMSEKNHLCCGSWMDKGRYFVYLSLEPTRSDLWVVATNRASAKPVRLTAGPLDFWRGPVPSSDGRHIFAIGEQMRGRLMRIDPVTRKPVPYLSEFSAEGVNFSPDGQWIAYTAFPEGSLWRSRVDGTQKLQLTTPPALARFPRWSPDGKTIGFIAASAGSNWGVYTVSATQGGVHRVLDNAANQGVPSWSPDGRSLAFGGLVELAQSQKIAIQILNLADGSLSTLPGSEGLWTPRWSPDGQYFAAITADNQTLRLFDTRTKTWTSLASLGANDVVWSSDSKFIFFDTPYNAVYRVRLSDRKVDLWADLSKLRRAGFFSPWLGVSPDGSPTFLADVGIQEVYSLQVDLP